MGDSPANQFFRSDIQPLGQDQQEVQAGLGQTPLQFGDRGHVTGAGLGQGNLRKFLFKSGLAQHGTECFLRFQDAEYSRY